MVRTLMRYGHPNTKAARLTIAAPNYLLGLCNRISVIYSYFSKSKQDIDESRSLHINNATVSWLTQHPRSIGKPLGPARWALSPSAQITGPGMGRAVQYQDPRLSTCHQLVKGEGSFDGSLFSPDARFKVIYF